MSTTPNSLVTNPPQQPGFFSKLGVGFQNALPYIQQIGRSLLTAGGSPQQLSEMNSQDELALRRQQLTGQQALQQSEMQSQDIARQLAQKNLENYQTPEQKDALALEQQRKLLSAQREFAPPQDIIAPADSGGMGHFQRTFNPSTGGYEVSSTMVNKEVPNPQVGVNAGFESTFGAPSLSSPPPTVTARGQLMALPKPVGGGMIVPDANSSTGFSKEFTDLLGNVIARVPNALPPAPFVPFTTSGTHTSIQKDVNGNLVEVPETTSTTKTPSLPGLATPQAPRGSLTPRRNVASPVTDSSGNPIHAPLGADAKKNIGQIDAANAMVESLLPQLDSLAKNNSLWDAGKQRAAWLEYKHGGVIPDNVDPNLAKLLPAIAQLQIVGGLPYMRGTRSFQYMQQIQQHLPNPETDSPALMVEKMHTLQQTLPLLKRAALESEGVQSNGPNPPAGAPPKLGDIKKFPNGRTGVWDGHGYVAQQ